MRLIIIYLIFLIPPFVYGQDFIYDQTYANRLLMNPAFCGHSGSGKYTISLFKHNQFAANRGPFNYSSFSVDYGICRSIFSLGLIGQTYTQGDGLLKTSSISLLSGAAIRLNNRAYMSVGAQYSYISTSVDWDRFVFSDQLDPVFGIINQSSNANANLFNQNNYGVSIGTKFMIMNRSKMLFFNPGVAYYHIVRPNNALLNNSVQLPARLTCHLGVLIKRNQNYLDNSFELHFRYDNQDQFKTFISRIGFYTKANIVTGISWRNNLYKDNGRFDTHKLLVDIRYVANNGIKYIVSGGLDVANKRTNVNGLGLGFELGIVFTPKPRYCKTFDILKKGGGTIDAGYDSRSNSKSKRGKMDCPSFLNDASKVRGYESDMF